MKLLWLKLWAINQQILFKCQSHQLFTVKMFLYFVFILLPLTAVQSDVLMYIVCIPGFFSLWLQEILRSQEGKCAHPSRKLQEHSTLWHAVTFPDSTAVSQCWQGKGNPPTVKCRCVWIDLGCTPASWPRSHNGPNISLARIKWLVKRETGLIGYQHWWQIGANVISSLF